MAEQCGEWIYDIADICVACGKPTLPGDMLCPECRRIADGKGPLAGEPRPHDGKACPKDSPADETQATG